MYSCGLRASEVCHLSLNQIDLEDELIRSSAKEARNGSFLWAARRRTF